MKTAETIEQQTESKSSSKYTRGKNPNSHSKVGNRYNNNEHEPIAIYRWKPGQSGNPGGRPKTDWAKVIARAIFENNAEALYQAYTKAALKGNAYAFKELADRAYGKLKERVEYDLSEYKDVSEKELMQRMQELEAKLGIKSTLTINAGPLELSGGTNTDSECTPPQATETQDR